MADKAWRAILPFESAINLFHLTRAGNALNDRQQQRNLEVADDEISKLLKVEYKLDGSFKLGVTKDDEPFEVEFSERAVRGFKTALVQGIVGVGQARLPEAVGVIKRTILPIAKLLRIESVVRKEANYLQAEDEAADELKPDEVVEG